jgi:hypothetical protein
MLESLPDLCLASYPSFLQVHSTAAKEYGLIIGYFHLIYYCNLHELEGGGGGGGGEGNIGLEIRK